MEADRVVIAVVGELLEVGDRTGRVLLMERRDDGAFVGLEGGGLHVGKAEGDAGKSTQRRGRLPSETVKR